MPASHEGIGGGAAGGDGGAPVGPIGRSAALPKWITVQFVAWDCLRAFGGDRSPYVGILQIDSGVYPDVGHSKDDRGDVRFFDTARAYYDPNGDPWAPSESGEDPYNLVDLAALTEKIRETFYAWRAIAFDMTGAGIIPWAADGFTDEVIFTYRDDSITTRVMSAPINDRAEQLNHAFVPPEGCTCCEEPHTTGFVAMAKESGVPPASRSPENILTLGQEAGYIYRLDKDLDPESPTYLKATASPCGNGMLYNTSRLAVGPSAMLQVKVVCGEYVVDWEDC